MAGAWPEQQAVFIFFPSSDVMIINSSIIMLFQNQLLHCFGHQISCGIWCMSSPTKNKVTRPDALKFVFL